MSNDSPFFITGSEQKGPWLITCDHARNHVPAAVNGGSLGLSVVEMQRHIAYDAVSYSHLTLPTTTPV